MITDDKIRDENLQYDINREARKILALSSRKIDKYEYVTGEEILPFNQRQTIVYIFSIRKSFWKTNKFNLRTRQKSNKNTWRACEATN